MKKRILPLLVVSALSLGIGVTTLTSCDVEIPVEAGPDFTDSKPVSVVSIEKTGTSGLVDTYTITYSDGARSTVDFTNGADGDDGEDGATGATGETGPQGPQGEKGEDGADGTSFLNGATDPTSETGKDGDT